MTSGGTKSIRIAIHKGRHGQEAGRYMAVAQWFEIGNLATRKAVLRSSQAQFTVALHEWGLGRTNGKRHGRPSLASLEPNAEVINSCSNVAQTRYLGPSDDV